MFILQALGHMTSSRCFLFLPIFYASFGVRSCISTGKNEVLPRTGPCVLNDDGMKCTEKGYYETVQCDDHGCFCVDAHNGFIAYDTRTDTNKIAPRCSNCHNTLKRIFANGDPPKNTFIPKCDLSMGLSTFVGIFEGESKCGRSLKFVSNCIMDSNSVTRLQLRLIMLSAYTGGSAQ
ncbi:hypothetical protein Y032_0015g2856 [Ancylostoma ceylanicum]|uniref:Thyroglobulin type-1 domain-containing protein n=1 Tax=Ancylostoma ceylanicum TaxID=53326 RepID=A0A016V9Y5_9BILA|nr:hypothetical protein Y032_0015g2856 [Ancylostoma ceylanicum]